MRSVDEHLAQILRTVPALPPVDLPLLEAAGAVLAEPVSAPVSLPPFDNSAMDGYAVLAADVAGASAESPASLPVIGDVAAGAQDVSRIRPGVCARIMTGAPMPGGADAVIPVEWTDGGVETVRIRRSAPSGHYIRRSGEDVRAGEVVVPAGTGLAATQLGMLAAVGRPRVPVRPRPRVAVLSTGTELREPGASLGHGQIWDSNSFMLAAAVAEAGGTADRQPTVGDDPGTVLERLEIQAARADAIVTSGGVSMGAHDVVKEVLAGTGTVEFHQVAMRPGKPQGFGLLRGTPIFTLPGNPVSAYVSFQLFVRPALRAMRGLPPDGLPETLATLTTELTSPAAMRHYLRAVLVPGGSGERDRARLAEGQGSHRLATLSTANALVVVPEGVDRVAEGSQVRVLRLPA